MTVSNSEIRERLKKFSYWYHKIKLSDSITTPGFDLDSLWDNTRKVRSSLKYEGKSVLDIAAFDGLFSFEAEQLGATEVISTDCQYRSFANLLFCKEILGSNVTPYYNVSPYNLVDRLDVYFDENFDDEKPNQRKFDIVQHLGLLYHLRDPLLSLSQARSVLNPGGHLLIETDLVLNRDEAVLVFNGLPKRTRIRDNYSIWWAPTRLCLFEMLNATMFEVLEDTYSQIEFDVPLKDAGRVETDNDPEAKYTVGRAAVVARAIEPGARDEKFERELMRTYRNPGLDLHRLKWH